MRSTARASLSLLLAVAACTALMWWRWWSSWGPRCADRDYCDLPLPTHSFFRFPPPTDEHLWRTACLHAALGTPILLEKVLEEVRHENDLLDGGLFYRKYNMLADFFLDNNNDLRVLSNSSAKLKVPGASRRKKYPWQMQLNNSVLPRSTVMGELEGRAAIVKVGYHAFNREGPNHMNSPFFMGDMAGEAVVTVDKLLRMWERQRDSIDVPYVLLHAASAHWGLLSTHFPGRSIDWGSCCEPAVRELLDSTPLIMLLTVQHSNMTHPKLVKLPVGLPLHEANYQKLIYDAMLTVRQQAVAKSALAVAYVSHTDKPFQAIGACIARAFPVGSVRVVDDRLRGSQTAQADEQLFAHFLGLATVRVGIAVPGPSYDTPRLWELLLMGNMAVTEKGIGLDKLLWRLPVLLVEDFSVLTPTLLRTAYVEALYRALRGEWEFQRLTQSFWWGFISSVARTQSSARILDFFPTEADERGWARPLQPMACAQSGTCGPGTLRSPASSC